MGNEATYPINTGLSAYDSRVQMWTSRRQRSQELKALHEADWLQYWDWYRNVTTPLNDPADWWRSNESVPTVFKVVETILPRYILGMFENPDWFTTEALNARSEEYETITFNLIKQAVDEMDIFPKLVAALRYSLIMGHCWGKVVWREDYETRQRLRPVPLTNMEVLEAQGGEEAIEQAAAMYGIEYLQQYSDVVGLEAEMVEEQTFNGPDFEWLSLDRVFPDPSGRGRWYVEEIHTTLEELQDTQASLDVYDPEALEMLENDTNTHVQGQYGGLDSIGDARSGTSAGVSMEFASEPETTEGIPEWIVTPKREGRGVTLWQCWGWVPADERQDDGAEWRITVLAEGKYVLRDEPSPTPDTKPPYFPIKSIDVPNNLYGDSFLKYVGPLAEQQTRLANMRLDEVFLGVWQQYLYKKNAVVSDNAMLMQPGGAIEVDPGVNGKINDVFTTLPRNPMLSDVWNEDIWRQTQAEDAAASGDIVQGAGGGSGTTATEVERKLQQANARHVLQVMYIDYTVKKELLERVWKWLQMRLTNSRIVKLQGEEYANIDLTNIQEPINIIVGGGLFALSKQTRVQMDQELIQLMTDPTVGQHFNKDKVLKKWMEDRGWKNPDKYLKSQEELDAELYQQGQDMVAAQMAQMEAQGAMAQAGATDPNGGASGPPGSPGANTQGTPPGVPAVQNAGGESSLAGRTIDENGPPTPTL